MKTDYSPRPKKDGVLHYAVFEVLFSYWAYQARETGPKTPVILGLKALGFSPVTA